MRKFKIALFSILSVFLATSCVTARKCASKFPPATDTIRTTVVRDSIVYRDTTIYLSVPGELRIDSIKIPCPPPKASFIPDTAFAETLFSTAKAWWSYPYIRLSLEQKDTTMLLKAVLRESYHWKSEYEKITTVPKPEKYIPKIYSAAFWLDIGFIVAILAYIAWRIFKPKFF